MAGTNEAPSEAILNADAALGLLPVESVESSGLFEPLGEIAQDIPQVASNKKMRATDSSDPPPTAAAITSTAMFGLARDKKNRSTLPIAVPESAEKSQTQVCLFLVLKFLSENVTNRKHTHV